MCKKEVIAFSVLFLILTVSCSVLKKSTKNSVPGTRYSEEYRILDLTRNNNFVKSGFLIKNAKVKIESNGYSGSINLLAKVNSYGDFMAIGKGPVGIEIFRIYGVNDSIWVIDRINRKIYEGKTSKVCEKYGMPADFWKILMGDLPENTILDTEKSSGSLDFINCVCNDSVYDRDIKISKRDLKVTDLNVYSYELKEDVNFRFDNFHSKNEIIFPGKVSVSSGNPVFHVEINIDNITCQVQDSIKKKLPDYSSVGL